MAATEELRDEVKTYIVQQLACYSTPSEIAKAVKEDFQVEVSRQRVQTYDPTKVAGKDLGAEMKAIFEATRKAYLEDKADIGIAQPTFRLRMYDRIARAAETRGNVVVALQACQQAAKDDGGAFTNEHRHKVGGDGGAPLVVEIVKFGTPDAGKAAK